MKILIVEDSFAQADGLRHLLEEHDFQSCHAANGLEALSLLEQQVFGLVISDIVMPQMDGYSLCSSIKAEKRWRDIPVILLTSLSDPSDVVKALASGADSFITKPYSEKGLLSRINQILQNRELRKDGGDGSNGEGFKIVFQDRPYVVMAGKPQMLDLLLSTFENAIEKNKELQESNRRLGSARHELRRLNDELEEKIRQRTSRVESLKAMLESIRKINRLIVHEKDRETLIREACAILAETRGYRGSSIILLDESLADPVMAAAGGGSARLLASNQGKQALLPLCLRKALRQQGTVINHASRATCWECPCLEIHQGMTQLTQCLKHAERTYGILTACLEPDLQIDLEGEALFRETAEDISFALHNILMEEERRQADTALIESERKFRNLSDKSPVGIYILQDGLFKYVNYAFAETFGYVPEEMIDRHLDIAYREELSSISHNIQKLISDAVASVHFHSRGIKKDRNIIHMEIYGSKIDYQGQPAIIGTLLDVTHRKQSEDELKRSYERLSRALNVTVEALAAIVERRDPYTAGHQRRVADLAVALAKELELETELIEAIFMAAIIHDLGKMNVPSELLSKPGRLSSLEFEMIKTHSQAGYDMVKKIEFPWPVSQIILQHHERMDGSGYPQGLIGEEILLEARILAVADVIESMISHRPYRPALGLDKAMEELARGRGTLYDPKVADACLTLFTEKGFNFEAEEGCGTN